MSEVRLPHFVRHCVEAVIDHCSRLLCCLLCGVGYMMVRVEGLLDSAREILELRTYGFGAGLSMRNLPLRDLLRPGEFNRSVM